MYRFYADDTAAMEDVSEIALRVSNIVEGLLRHRQDNLSKRTFGWLSERIRKEAADEVSADAIRQFMASVDKLRSGKTSRVNRKNRTLEILYNFIIRSHHKYPEIQKVYTNNLLGADRLRGPREALKQTEQIASVALGAQDWLLVPGKDTILLGDKLVGSHYVIRKSPRVKESYIKSELEVSLHGNGDASYLKITHRHQQQLGLQERLSHGFTLRLVKNIYAALRIDGHEGLEMMAMREEAQTNPRFFKGFMIGVDSDRKVYDSAMLVIPRLSAGEGEKACWEKLESRFTETDPIFLELLSIRADLGGLMRSVFPPGEESRMVRHVDGTE